MLTLSTSCLREAQSQCLSGLKWRWNCYVTTRRTTYSADFKNKNPLRDALPVFERLARATTQDVKCQTILFLEKLKHHLRQLGTQERSSIMPIIKDITEDYSVTIAN